MLLRDSHEGWVHMACHKRKDWRHPRGVGTRRWRDSHRAPKGVMARAGVCAGGQGPGKRVNAEACCAGIPPHGGMVLRELLLPCWGVTAAAWSPTLWDGIRTVATANDYRGVAGVWVPPGASSLPWLGKWSCALRKCRWQHIFLLVWLQFQEPECSLGDMLAPF